MSVSRDRRILILGDAGSGKSSVGNAILGKKLFPVPLPSLAEGQERENIFLKKTRRVNGGGLTVVVTQGPRDCDVADQTRAPEVVGWLAECAPGPHAFIIVINLHSYSRGVLEGINRVNWATEEVIEESRGTEVAGGETETGMNVQTERPLGRCPEEVGNGRKDVEGRKEEQNQGIEGKWWSVQQCFGDEALNYTVVVFIHGRKLSRKDRRQLLREDKHLKELIRKCGDRHHILSSKNCQKRGQIRKLLSIIDTMVNQNGGRHYTNELLRSMATAVQVEEPELRRPTLKLPVAIAMPTELTREVLESMKKKLMNMAVGATVGALVGAMLGISLKVSVLLLNRLGPSMIVYFSVLVVPAIMGRTEIGGFSLSSLSGSVIGGFFTMMCIVGAVLGAVLGSKVAAESDTLKEAAHVAARSLIEKEKAALRKAWQKGVVQRFRSSTAAQDVGPSTASPDTGPGDVSEPSEEVGTSENSKTDPKNIHPEPKPDSAENQHHGVDSQISIVTIHSSETSDNKKHRRLTQV